MIRALLEWVHRLFRPSYVEVGPPARIHPPRVPPQPTPVVEGARARIKYDPDAPCVVASDGLLVQRAAVDVLLADGRMSRLGVLAAFDAATHEPRRISYVPIHEVAPSSEVAP